MAIEETKQELERFLKDAKIVKVDMEEVSKLGEAIFNAEEGQRMLTLAMDVFTKSLEAQIKEKGALNANDKVNILAQVLVILEMEDHITIKSKINASGK